MTPDSILQAPRPERARLVAQKYEEGGWTYDTLGEWLEVTRNTVAGLIRDAKRKYSRIETAHAESIAANDGAQAGVVADPIIHQTGEQSSSPTVKFVTVDERRAAHRAYLGTSYQLRPVAAQQHNTRMVCAVGDLHGKPDDAIVAALVERKADVYFFGGDIMDQYFASTHPPESVDELLAHKEAKVRDDIAGPRALLETLLEETDGECLIMPGNHDLRTLKTLYTSVPPSMWELFNDPLDILVFGLAPRVRIVSHPTTYYHPDGSEAGSLPDARFIYLLGDVLLSHLNFTGNEPGQAALKLYNKWFLKWMYPLRLDHVRALIQFHVHRQSYNPVAGGWHLLIEPGMGGNVSVEAYKWGYQGKWSPGFLGFVSFEQYKGVDYQWHTDLSSIEMVAPRMTGHAQGVVDGRTRAA